VIFFNLPLLCVKTFQESLNSLTIILIENKTDARVDGAIGDSHEIGNKGIDKNATRRSSTPCK